MLAATAFLVRFWVAEGVEESAEIAQDVCPQRCRTETPLGKTVEQEKTESEKARGWVVNYGWCSSLSDYERIPDVHPYIDTTSGRICSGNMHYRFVHT